MSILESKQNTLKSIKDIIGLLTLIKNKIDNNKMDEEEIKNFDKALWYYCIYLEDIIKENLK